MEHLDTFQSEAEAEFWPVDEPKHTKAAAYVTNIYQDRILVLWRNKWEGEGTPLILPGGGTKDLEDPKDTVIREVGEEIGVELNYDNVFYSEITFKTIGTNKIKFFNVIPAISSTLIKLDSTKFSGCLWIPVNNVKVMKSLYPLCMQGLQQLMEYMKWV